MEIIRLTEGNLIEAAKKAAAVLKKGGIVAYPTDTVYGLGVSITDPTAIERLRTLKGRERKKPVSLIVQDVHHIEMCGTLTPLAEKFAASHLPGALTLVIPAKKDMPETLTMNGAVGVRVPNEPFCLALAKEYGKPYTTTSANKAGMGTPRNVQGLMEHFGLSLDQIDLIIDGGDRAGGNPSTVVSCVGEIPYVLREGAVSRQELGL
ncbi:MAG TPA: L-threonylcarbamoyladenylate synthase [Candidatus Paceibacterota bacterium]|nr:L-threonylcarbamoyladenylate synthase [Candidatus Paceibacterota bacterium]